MPRVNPDAIARRWGFPGVTGDHVRAVLQASSKDLVLGADMAPTHSALVGLLGEEIPMHKTFLKVDTKEWTYQQRYSFYSDELTSSKCSMVSLEEYTFQTKKGYDIIQIAENGALFKLAAETLKVHLLKVAPIRVKSFVLRQRQENKQPIMDFGRDITDGWVDEVSKNRRGQVNSTTLGDVCDSLALALAGAFALAQFKEPTILSSFPVPFIRLFTNKDGNGLTDSMKKVPSEPS